MKAPKLKERASFLRTHVPASLFWLVAAFPSPELMKKTEGPFYWKEKPAIWKTLVNDQKITTSATEDKGVWSIKGAGIVEAPADFTFQTTLQLQRLGEISSYFEDVIWNPETGHLSLKIRFLGKKWTQKFTIVPKPPEHIYFRVIEGGFRGYEGFLLVKDFERHKGQASSEVGFSGEFKGEIAWVPDFIFGRAAEAVMHHVAQSLRTLVHQDYKLRNQPRE